MNKKVLFCATVDIHFMKFHLPYLKWFKDQGWEVHVAALGRLPLPYVDQKFNIPIQRSPFKLKNIRAYKELKTIMDQNRYQIIHCHTPMGGVLARLAARKARNAGTKLIYTAHGFHFCQGAPLTHWLLYYPIERVLSRYTDCLVTINEEDYQRALNHRFKAGMICRVHGVGVDTDRFKPTSEIEKYRLRENLGYQHDHFIMFFAAEFNVNKNQQFLIKALSLIKEKVPKAKLLLAGDGPLLSSCRTLAEQLGVNQMVDFLGYQDDIKPFLHISDLAVASSLREGLPVNIMEAMASRLPILVTKNRGHNELVKDGFNGFLIPPEDVSLFSARLLQLYRAPQVLREMGTESLKYMDTYTLGRAGEEMKAIYLNLFGEKERSYHEAYL